MPECISCSKQLHLPLGAADMSGEHLVKRRPLKRTGLMHPAGPSNFPQKGKVNHTMEYKVDAKGVFPRGVNREIQKLNLELIWN